MWFVFLSDLWFHNIPDAPAVIVLWNALVSSLFSRFKWHFDAIGDLYLSGTTTADSPRLKADRRPAAFGQNKKGVKKTTLPLLFVCDSTQL